MSEIAPGVRLTLTVEKAVAGGQMLARHAGQVVLVQGAIPGERVEVEVRRLAARTPLADVVAVLEASPDRREAAGDPGCGGQAYAHIAYPRQLALKAEVLIDAWVRVGRQDWPDVALTTVGSPEHGYRMRARLHGDGRRIGFLRDGTHQVCGAEAGGQLRPETVAWVNALAGHAASAGAAIESVEITESVDGSRRACHLTVRRPLPPALAAVLGGDGATAVSWSVQTVAPVSRQGRGRGRQAAQRPAPPAEPGASLVDAVHPVAGHPGVALRRHARAFFQGNRYLLDPLVQHVVDAAGRESVLDLYAGVGLFGVSAVAAGTGAVVAVEGDAISGADLEHNARDYAAHLQPLRQSVEQYLEGRAAARFRPRTVILDPPRTGMRPEAARRLVQLGASRIVFVSCDPATFARDARLLTDAGYALTGATLFDLFPNTAHVETVGVFDRR